MNSNRQSRAVCFPVPLVPSRELSAFVHVCWPVCLLLGEGKDTKVKDRNYLKHVLEDRQHRDEW